MSNNEQLKSAMQMIVSSLSQQADGHAIQSRIFAAQGFNKLAAKYAEHASEERSYVDQIVDRLLDFGFEVKNEAKESMTVCYDPVEWVKVDLKVSKDGLEALAKIIKMAEDDLKTYDLLKQYYIDEEEDMYWGEQQLELIEKIGVQNWLVLQL